MNEDLIKIKKKLYAYLWNIESLIKDGQNELFMAYKNKEVIFIYYCYSKASEYCCNKLHNFKNEGFLV